MIVAESRRGRRIVGRLDRGQDLFETLLSICRERRVRAGEIRALGSFESVEVAEYDQAARRWKPGRGFAAGGMEVVSFTGNVSERDGQLALHAHVVLMRDRDNGVETLAGHLNAARVFALEFVIEAFDDLILRRAADPATGLNLWKEALSLDAAAAAPPEPAPPPSAPPPAPAAATWQQVAAVSSQKPPPEPDPEPEDDEAIDALEPGDVLMHPTFGRSEVQRIEGSYEFAHVRLKNGRLVRLSLDVLKVARAGNEGNRRIFKAKVDG